MTATPVPLPDYTTWSEADQIAHINALNANARAIKRSLGAVKDALRLLEQ